MAARRAAGGRCLCCLRNQPSASRFGSAGGNSMDGWPAARGAAVFGQRESRWGSVAVHGSCSGGASRLACGRLQRWFQDVGGRRGVLHAAPGRRAPARRGCVAGGVCQWLDDDRCVGHRRINDLGGDRRAPKPGPAGRCRPADSPDRRLAVVGSDDRGCRAHLAVGSGDHRCWCLGVRHGAQPRTPAVGPAVGPGRAVRAMQLDVNPDWTVLATYNPATPTGAASPANGTNLVAGTVQGPWTFFEPTWARDFFTMSARSGPIP